MPNNHNNNNNNKIMVTGKIRMNLKQNRARPFQNPRNFHPLLKKINLKVIPPKLDSFTAWKISS